MCGMSYIICIIYRPIIQLESQKKCSIPGMFRHTFQWGVGIFVVELMMTPICCPVNFFFFFFFCPLGKKKKKKILDWFHVNLVFDGRVSKSDLPSK